MTAQPALAAQVTWTPPWEIGAWGEYITYQWGFTAHFGHAEGSLWTGYLGLHTEVEAIDVGGIGAVAQGEQGLFSETFPFGGGSALRDHIIAEVNNRLLQMEKEIEEAVGKPGAFGEHTPGKPSIVLVGKAGSMVFEATKSTLVTVVSQVKLS